MRDDIKIDLKGMGYEHVGLDSSTAGEGSVMSSCEYGNETLDFIKDGKYIFYLIEY
jgi:hypothetical protein